MPAVVAFPLALVLPLAALPAAPAPAEQGRWLPFELESGRPTVEVTLDGHGPYRFILDTGAGASSVDAGLAAELALPVVGSTDVGAPGMPTSMTDVVAVERLTAGPVVVAETTLSTVDLGGLAAGILAPRSLPGGHVALDFPARRVLLDREPLDAGAPDTLPFESPDGLIALPLTVGDVTLTAHLDTGSPGGLMMPKSLADELAWEGEPREVGHARLLGGESTVYAARLAGVAAAGALRLVDPEVHILDLPLPAANLGSGLLGGTLVDVDYERGLVRFVPATSGVEPAAASPAPARRRLGIAVAPGAPGPGGLPLVDGGLPVGGVDAGSLAEAAGIRAGDRIVAVNGTAVTDLDAPGLGALFGGHDRLEIDLLRDGAERTVVVPGD